jgi:two-component system, OmpR family, sensor kinase
VRTLPIRLRIALSVTAVAAVLLTIVGAFGYARLSNGFSRDLDLELRQRAQDLVGPLSHPGSSLTDLAWTGFIERGESFAEVLTPSGHLVDSTPTLRGRVLLSPGDARRAALGTVTLDRNSAPGLNEPARLLATPLSRQGRPLVLVVGDTRENGLEALRHVRNQLLVAVPLLLLVSFAGAYAVAGAALRPVESMRRRAAAMTTGDPSLRLPVPPSGDEITRLGETLNGLLARVEATLERERSFVAHASHELRTPLALLRTEIDLALRRPRTQAELTSALESAGEEVDRLQRLAEDLLLLAQEGEGRLEAHLEETHVDDVLRGAAEPFGAVLAREGRTLVVEPDGGQVLLDRRQVHRALTNLVANAAQHGSGEVRLSARRGGASVALVVSDGGDGFGADMLEHGAERFVRGSASQGAGLGLSIVAAVARAHGGDAGMSDAHGTEAWVAVPATTSSDLPPTRAPAPGAAQPRTPSPVPDPVARPRT